MPYWKFPAELEVAQCHVAALGQVQDQSPNLFPLSSAPSSTPRFCFLKEESMF